MIQPTRVLQLAKEKSRQLRHSIESEKFSCKLEKFLTVYHGYNQLKPKIFPKRMGVMFPADVVVASEGQHRNFHPAFGSTASLKRHREDWSEKYQTTRPGYAATSAASIRAPDGSGRIHIVGGTDGQADKRKPYGSVGRTRKLHTKSPRRVVLRTPEPGSENQSGHSSSNILCSSVFLTYREGLFYNAKQRSPEERNCTDV